MRRSLAVLVLVAGLAAPSTTAFAQTASQCEPGQTPTFGFGFADLRSRLGVWMGDPLTCEFADPSGTGDVHQRTTGGLAFWRKSTNTSTYTNGSDHWGLNPDGFVYWTGPSIDPPADALATTGNPDCLPGSGTQACSYTAKPPPLEVQGVTASAPAAATYDTRNGPRTEAQLRTDLAAAGYGGPWDVNSMLAAYRNATSAPAAAVAAAQPAPKQDFSAECQAFTNALPGKIGNKILLLSNIMLNCTYFASRDGANGLKCYKNVLQKEMTDAIIYSSADFDSRYLDCLDKQR